MNPWSLTGEGRNSLPAVLEENLEVSLPNANTIWPKKQSSKLGGNDNSDQSDNCSLTEEIFTNALESTRADIDYSKPESPHGTTFASTN